MIRASEIADAISAIDSALEFVMEVESTAAERTDVRLKLIRARIDLEFSLRETHFTVVDDLKKEAA